MPNKAYKNLGDLRFADQGKEWGFTNNLFLMVPLMPIWTTMVTSTLSSTTKINLRLFIATMHASKPPTIM